MVRKIGSILLIMATALICSEPQINIKITDLAGNSLTNVVKSVPFALDVIISGDQLPEGTPKLAGIHKLRVQEQSFNTINRIINGKRSVRKIYRYIVRADFTGSLIIGPATLDGVKLQSDKITITVTDQEKFIATKPVLQIVSPVNKAVIGQAVPLNIRFFSGNDAQLVDISQLELTNGFAQPMTGPYSGVDHIDDNDVPYVEWRTIWYPSKTGQCTIPALQAVYKSPQKSRQSQFGFDLISIFNHGFEQKKLYSNSLTIEVDPLPAYQHDVSAVGEFKNIKAIVEPSTANIGEGVVFKLLITGNGNMHAIQAPQLNLPDGLKYYESKQYMQVDKTNNMDQTKIFEYILQATKQGEYKIPGQSFYFYNVNTDSYKKIISNKLSFTAQASQQNKPMDDKPNTVAPATADTLLPLMQEQWYAIQQRRIPNRFFFLLLFVPLIIGLLAILRFQWQRYCLKNSAKFLQMRAYADAQKRLKKALKSGNKAVLYSLFVAFFEQKLQHAVNQDAICAWLMQKNFSADEIERWNSFYARCAQATFVANQAIQEDILFKEAELWLKLFSQRL